MCAGGARVVRAGSWPAGRAEVCAAPGGESSAMGSSMAPPASVPGSAGNDGRRRAQGAGRRARARGGWIRAPPGRDCNVRCRQKGNAALAHGENSKRARRSSLGVPRRPGVRKSNWAEGEGSIHLSTSKNSSRITHFLTSGPPGDIGWGQHLGALRAHHQPDRARATRARPAGPTRDPLAETRTRSAGARRTTLAGATPRRLGQPGRRSPHQPWSALAASRDPAEPNAGGGRLTR